MNIAPALPCARAHEYKNYNATPAQNCEWWCAKKKLNHGKNHNGRKNSMRRLYHARERMSTKTTMQYRRKIASGGVRKKSLIVGKIVTGVKNSMRRIEAEKGLP